MKFIVKKLEEGIYEVRVIRPLYDGKTSSISMFKGNIVECNAYVSLKTNKQTTF